MPKSFLRLVGNPRVGVPPGLAGLHQLVVQRIRCLDLSGGGSPLIRASAVHRITPEDLWKLPLEVMYSSSKQA